MPITLVIAFVIFFVFMMIVHIQFTTSNFGDERNDRIENEKFSLVVNEGLLYDATESLASDRVTAQYTRRIALMVATYIGLIAFLLFGNLFYATFDRMSFLGAAVLTGCVFTWYVYDVAVMLFKRVRKAIEMWRSNYNARRTDIFE